MAFLRSGQFELSRALAQLRPSSYRSISAASSATHRPPNSTPRTKQKTTEKNTAVTEKKKVAAPSSQPVNQHPRSSVDEIYKRDIKSLAFKMENGRHVFLSKLAVIIDDYKLLSAEEEAKIVGELSDAYKIVELRLKKLNENNTDEIKKFNLEKQTSEELKKQMNDINDLRVSIITKHIIYTNYENDLSEKLFIQIHEGNSAFVRELQDKQNMALKMHSDFEKKVEERRRATAAAMAAKTLDTTTRIDTKHANPVAKQTREQRFAILKDNAGRNFALELYNAPPSPPRIPEPLLHPVKSWGPIILGVSMLIAGGVLMGLFGAGLPVILAAAGYLVSLVGTASKRMEKSEYKDDLRKYINHHYRSDGHTHDGHAIYYLKYSNPPRGILIKSFECASAFCKEGEKLSVEKKECSLRDALISQQRYQRIEPSRRTNNTPRLLLSSSNANSAPAASKNKPSVLRVVGRLPQPNIAADHGEDDEPEERPLSKAQP